MKTICLVFCLVALAAARPHHNDNSDSSAEKDFDYLVFRQSWPKTSCMFPGAHQCTIGKTVENWVIHGLWPNYVSGYPSFCNKTDKFNPALIEPLIKDLSEYWPNLYADTPLNSFWQHEWEKHGTCALSLKQINNERDYFQVTLGLREKFSFGDILAKSSIVPDISNGYKLSDIVEAVKSVLDFEPVVTCFVEKESSVQYISQMQVCLSKDLELIDCSVNGENRAGVNARKGASEQECKKDMPVYYPVLDKNQKVTFNL